MIRYLSSGARFTYLGPALIAYLSHDCCHQKTCVKIARNLREDDSKVGHQNRLATWKIQLAPVRIFTRYYAHTVTIIWA